MTEATETPVTSEPKGDDLAEWLEGISQGKAETIVTSEGKGYSFNCDGTAHYLQENDVTKREPNGRYKRVYKGKIEGSHVTHKGVTSDIPCPAQYERWAKVRHVNGCRIPEGNGTDKGRLSDSKRPNEQVALHDAGWQDAKTLYIQ